MTWRVFLNNSIIAQIISEEFTYKLWLYNLLVIKFTIWKYPSIAMKRRYCTEQDFPILPTLIY